jgi:hypothetical protein
MSPLQQPLDRFRPTPRPNASEAVGRSTLPSDPALSPGITDLDCHGPPDPLADASFEELWLTCNLIAQDRIARSFAARCADEIRDALLDSAHLPGQTNRSIFLGRRLFHDWLDHRDRALSDLHRRGLLVREVTQ